MNVVMMRDEMWELMAPPVPSVPLMFERLEWAEGDEPAWQLDGVKLFHHEFGWAEDPERTMARARLWVMEQRERARAAEYWRLVEMRDELLELVEAARREVAEREQTMVVGQFSGKHAWTLERRPWWRWWWR